jgi:hypothetical protein
MELICCVWPHAFWPEGRAEGTARRRARPLGTSWQLWEMVFADVGHQHPALEVHLTQRYRGHAKYVFA